MASAKTSEHRLLSALLLAGLLLAGRTVLAVHSYQHDLATSAPDCELCQFCHCSGEGPAPDEAPLSPECNPARSSLPIQAPLVAPTIRYRARAPPALA